MKKNTDYTDITSMQVLKRLLSFTKPYLPYMVIGIISAFAGVLLSLWVPVWTGSAIDYIIGPGEVYMGPIAEILLRMGIAIASSAFFQWLMNYCMNHVTYHTVEDLRTKGFEKLGVVPLKYIDDHAHGDVIHTLVNDIDQISDGLLQGFVQLLTGVVTIVGTLFLMLSIDVQIALIVVVLTPLSIFVAVFISKRIHAKFREQSEIRGELSGYIEEMLGNQKVVRAFGYEDRSMEHFKEVNDRLYDCGVMAQFYSSMTNPCTRYVNSVIYAIVGIIGAVRVIQGNFSVGRLSSFLAYANQYTKPFNEISGVITELQSAFASARRVFALIDEEPEPSDEHLQSGIICNGKVEIRDVSFRYREEIPLIEQFNLSVAAGQTVAIVGPTGCGKTTMINLLMRFYDVNAGQILAADEDISQMKRKTLRDMYGMVLQDSWLFHGTIRDNIAYGRPDATEEEIIAAAKAAYAHNFIRRMPDGYDTVISEEGNNISQGQKQLLCIARVMLTKPPMLILDEATSNIDTLTEIRVQKAFAKLMEGRTSFIVAHRLSTIKEADVILVMDKGHIVEQGSHQELLDNQGFYADLYNSQFAVME